MVPVLDLLTDYFSTPMTWLTIPVDTRAAAPHSTFAVLGIKGPAIRSVEGPAEQNSLTKITGQRKACNMLFHELAGESNLTYASDWQKVKDRG